MQELAIPTLEGRCVTAMPSLQPTCESVDMLSLVWEAHILPVAVVTAYSGHQ